MYANFKYFILVFVSYCASWGYESMYEFAKEIIQTVYPNAKLVGEPTKKGWGAFEVTVTKKNGTPKNVFNKLGGDGKLSSEEA